MKDVFRLIRERSNRLSKNRLFTEWLQNDAIEPQHKFVFAPLAIDFIMGFRDLNKYYLTYPNPRDEFENAINEHAREDESHAYLYLEDWAALGIDERFGWAPRDLYWWMTSGATVDSRRADFELVSMIYHHPDPLIRFAMIESIEEAGNVFFTRTVPIVAKLAAKTGQTYPYFGDYHLERETGHLQNADERAFFRASLTDEQRALARSLAGRVFDIFEFHFTSWEAFARAVHEERWHFDPRAEGRQLAQSMRDEPQADLSAYMHLDHPRDLTGVALELAAQRKRCFQDLWDTPSYTWVREAWPGDFKRMIRYFLLQWVVDNWTCADYFAFDTTYAEPRTPLERGLNRLSTLYASEMNRRYVEWETLGFDEYTGWSAREALLHYWLDAEVQEHRAVFADLRKLTFKYPKPLHRYWIMKCFVRFGDTLMHSLGVAMRRAQEEDENFITFAGYPERLHPDLPPDPEADSAIESIEREPLSPEDYAIIQEIIRETYAQEARRSEITWRVVQGKRYEAFDRRWEERRGGARESVLPRAHDGLHAGAE